MMRRAMNHIRKWCLNTFKFNLPSVAEDVDDGERGRLSMTHLADHATERARRLQHAARDVDILRQTILH